MSHHHHHNQHHNQHHHQQQYGTQQYYDPSAAYYQQQSYGFPVSAAQSQFYSVGGTSQYPQQPQQYGTQNPAIPQYPYPATQYPPAGQYVAPQYQTPQTPYSPPQYSEQGQQYNASTYAQQPYNNFQQQYSPFPQQPAPQPLQPPQQLPQQPVQPQQQPFQPPQQQPFQSPQQQPYLPPQQQPFKPPQQPIQAQQQIQPQQLQPQSTQQHNEYNRSPPQQHRLDTPQQSSPLSFSGSASPLRHSSSLSSSGIFLHQSQEEMQLLTQEQEKIQKMREELLHQQETMRQQQEELNKKGEELKAKQAEEEQKFRFEAQQQREELEKIKVDLAKQSAEDQQQKERVAELQMVEMRRQMEELMREQELSKRHEEETRKAMLEEQNLVLQQLKQQQADLAQQQQAAQSKAQLAEAKIKHERQKLMNEQKKHEDSIQQSRRNIEQQQEALKRQMDEANTAVLEKQRLLEEQFRQAESQQKQTEAQQLEAENLRKQAEVAAKEQQAVFAQQQEELRRKQDALAAEQERLASQSRENEAKIEIDKKQLAAQLDQQTNAIKKQQEDVERQQELITLQRKELLVKQQGSIPPKPKSKVLRDVLTPMRLEMQPNTSASIAVDQPNTQSTAQPEAKLATQLYTQPTAQPDAQPDAQLYTQPTARPDTHPTAQSDAQQPTLRGKKRPDSRVLHHLNHDEIVMGGYKLGHVITVQRYVRRWSMRKRFVLVVKQYHSSNDATVDRLKHRSKALHEIYTSELSYLANLQLLSNYYVVPFHVETMVKKRFSEKDATVIFSSVNTLLDVSKGLVSELEARLHEWPSVQLLGDIFVKLAPVMKLYAEYINNFEASLQRLKALLATQEGLSFFADCKQKSRSTLDVNSLLIMPVQRLPRYELLLKEVLRFTHDTHRDYQNLEQALKAIQGVNSYINQKKKDTDSRQKLTAIQHLVKGSPNLLGSHRYYLHEGNLQVSTFDKQKTGSFFFFLFNDLLLATKKCSGIFHGGHEYEYAFSIDISEATVKQVAGTPMFRLMIGGLEDLDVTIYTFLCKSSSEKDSWLENFINIQNDPTHGSAKRLLVKEASQVLHR